MADKWIQEDAAQSSQGNCNVAAAKRPKESGNWNAMKKPRGDVQENQTESKCPMTGALSNDLILDCVFKYLNISDLIRFRLVNGQWKRTTTKVLKKRINAAVRVNRKTDLAALESCISSSADFPFHEIHMSLSSLDFPNSPGDWRSSPEKWLEVELFRQHSRKFTRLQLKSDGTPGTVVTSLLSGRFNHIETLTLHQINANFSERNASFKFAHHLENLKTITFGMKVGCEGVNSNFLDALLQSCPNLELIENSTNAHLRALYTTGKLDCVKTLRVCSCINQRSHYPMPTGVEMLIIADGGPKDGSRIEKVELSCLLPLLQRNRYTVRRIEVYNHVAGDEESDDWPKLDKLTSLKLMKPFYFPENVDEIFPALKTLELGAYPDDRHFFKRIGKFMWKEALPSVSMLEVFRPSSVSFEAWKCLAKAVPNVHHVFLGYQNRDCKMKDEVTVPWDGISCFKQLETLYLTPIELPRTNLDQVLTGISSSLMKKLKEISKLAKCDLKDKKGIVLLTGLKELVIGVTMPSGVGPKTLKLNRPVSHFALEYGLNLLPAELKVRFLYDQWSLKVPLIEEALRPVSGRATFGHWNATEGYWGVPECSTGLVTCQRTEHPRLNPDEPWIDSCSRGWKPVARKSTGGIPPPRLIQRRRMYSDSDSDSEIEAFSESAADSEACSESD